MRLYKFFEGRMTRMNVEKIGLLLTIKRFTSTKCNRKEQAKKEKIVVKGFPITRFR